MSQATAIKRHDKAMIQAEKHLYAAAKALAVMYISAKEAGFPVKGLDDTRVTLQEKCREYAGYLNTLITQKS